MLYELFNRSAGKPCCDRFWIPCVGLIEFLVAEKTLWLIVINPAIVLSVVVLLTVVVWLKVAMALEYSLLLRLPCPRPRPHQRPYPRHFSRLFLLPLCPSGLLRACRKRKRHSRFIWPSLWQYQHSRFRRVQPNPCGAGGAGRRRDEPPSRVLGYQLPSCGPFAFSFLILLVPQWCRIPCRLRLPWVR